MLLSKEILLITKITPQNVKKMLLYLAILKKHFSMCQGENLATLGIFTTKWISNDNLNPEAIGIVRSVFFDNINNWLELIIWTLNTAWY